jgi:hypothetical protein
VTALYRPAAGTKVVVKSRDGKKVLGIGTLTEWKPIRETLSEGADTARFRKVLSVETPVISLDGSTHYGYDISWEPEPQP